MLMLGQGQFTSGEEAANLSKADQSGEQGGFARSRRTQPARLMCIGGKRLIALAAG